MFEKTNIAEQRTTTTNFNIAAYYGLRGVKQDLIFSIVRVFQTLKHFKNQMSMNLCRKLQYIRQEKIQ